MGLYTRTHAYLAVLINQWPPCPRPSSHSPWPSLTAPSTPPPRNHRVIHTYVAKLASRYDIHSSSHSSQPFAADRWDCSVFSLPFAFLEGAIVVM